MENQELLTITKWLDRLKRNRQVILQDNANSKDAIRASRSASICALSRRGNRIGV